MTTVVRLLAPDDAPAFRDLRLHGLRDTPEAFGSTYAEDVTLSLDTIARRIAHSRVPRCQCVFGAFVDHELVGVAGCIQDGKLKSRHRAMVWGMYVRGEHRGQGIGRRLLEQLIAETRSWSGVDRLRLSVVERADTARQLYRALGFERFGLEPDALRQDGVSDAMEHLTLALREPPRR